MTGRDIKISQQQRVLSCDRRLQQQVYAWTRHAEHGSHLSTFLGKSPKLSSSRRPRHGYSCLSLAREVGCALCDLRARDIDPAYKGHLRVMLEPDTKANTRARRRKSLQRRPSPSSSKPSTVVYPNSQAATRRLRSLRSLCILAVRAHAKVPSSARSQCVISFPEAQMAAEPSQDLLPPTPIGISSRLHIFSPTQPTS